MPNEVAVTDSETVVSVPVKIKRAAISALGGKRAHELGVAHRYTSEEAALAGKSGGTAPHVSRGRGKSE
jgi:hypothetical protein